MPDIFVGHSEKKEEAIEQDKIGGNVYIFSAFTLNPSDISFKNQEKDEKILLFVRKHFLTNLKWVLTAVLLSLVPIFFPLILSDLNSFFNLPGKYILFLVFSYYLLLATYVFINFVSWFFNVSFITNLRLVDVDFSGSIYKNVASTKLSLVQDVSYDQTGVLRTFFNYGDVIIQTAGEQKHFDLVASPKPSEIVHLVSGMIGKHGSV
jgi:hypothetical protein